jgi:hypothetical protein
MNNQANDIIDCIYNYFTRLELLIFSKTNKRFKKHSQNVLKYKYIAFNNDCISNKNVLICSNAAAEGYLEVLKYARDILGCDWNYYTCAYAAYGGHLEVLQWARKNGCEWNSETCAHAAYGGHLEVLKWLRKNGCNWDMNTCRYAVKNGHLDILKWARASKAG